MKTLLLRIPAVLAAVCVLASSRAGAQAGSARPIDGGLGPTPRPMPPIPATSAAVALEKLRSDYAAAYNRRDAAAVAALFASDAVTIGLDGTVLRGHAEILRAVTKAAPQWGRLTITPLQTPEPGDHLGATFAWSVGTTTIARSEGPPSPRGAMEKTDKSELAHYLVVLGAENGTWKIKALASVPVEESRDHGGPTSQ